METEEITEGEKEKKKKSHCKLVMTGSSDV